MINKKKILLNILWFLVGMAAIAAVPLLLFEKCSEAGKPEPETGFSRSFQ
jgi:hypothetical protein